MKHFLFLLNALIAVLLFFSACEKAEPLKIYQAPVKPTLSITPTGNTASFEDSTVSVLNLSWTNPQFSQDRSLYKFYLEIDSTGKNFSNAQILELNNPSFTNNNFTSTIIGNQLNNVLYSLGLLPNQKYEVDFRLIASYGNNNQRQVTDKITVELIPYAFPKVPIPVEGNLWITGSAVLSSWTPSPPDSQKFNRISSTLYELTIEMIGRGGYKLIQDQGNWETQYRRLEGNWESGKFDKKNDDPEFLAPPEKAVYKITIDFLEGTYKLEKQ
jgi:hypothetical protein